MKAAKRCKSCRAFASSEEELRATGQYRVLTPNQMVEETSAKGPAAYVLCHPLMGGIPPETGWRSLRLLEKEVMPRLP